MKSIISFMLVAVAVCTGCASNSSSPQESGARTSYYDRNRDDKADLETHRHPGIADADWDLRDDDYNGRYEKKILYGFAVKQSAVDIPVPTDVHVKQNSEYQINRWAEVH